MNIARALVREPDVVDAAHYRRRVTHLAWIYPALFAMSATGLAILVWRGRFLVTLTQRSNVETLTIAFFLLFFSYLMALTAAGAWGGARVWGYRLWATLADQAGVDRRRLVALGKVGDGQAVGLSHVVEREDRPGQAFALQIRDALGSMGALRIDGVRLHHIETHRGGTNNLLAYFVQQLCEVLALRPDAVDVVQWKSIDQEAWHQYVAGVDAMRAIERRLPGEGAVWPRVSLSAAHCAELERRLSQLCETLRDEALLPHWEFEGEHKLPIIPEPLGIVSLSRRESRVDPLSSMAAALVVVTLAVSLITWFIVKPPWVPGR